MFLLIVLLVSFSSFLIREALKVGDFSPHLSSLDLDAFNVVFKLSELSTEVGALISLDDALVTESGSLKSLLIQHALGTLAFVTQVNILLGFVTKKELEVL